MKPALYYAFRSGWGEGLGYSIVAITSTKGNRMWYGRDWQEISSHGLISELHGRFETKEKALAVIDGLKAIQAIYKPRFEANRKELNELYRQQRNDENELFKVTP